MASLIDSLISVLNNENTEYNKLLNLSKDKTSAIVAGNVDELHKIYVQETRIIEGLDSLEKQRLAFVAEICKVLHLSLTEIKVEQIIQLLEKKPKEHDALEDAYMQLKRTVKQLTALNENNKVLLKESMDMIEFEINLMKNAMIDPQTNNYGKGAYEEQGNVPIGRFDAKQ